MIGESWGQGFPAQVVPRSPVLEGVDEDVEDADATMRDELVMLARNSPLWKEELKRYLQREEKEREQMEKERAARLACWREDKIGRAHV